MGLFRFDSEVATFSYRNEKQALQYLCLWLTTHNCGLALCSQ